MVRPRKTYRVWETRMRYELCISFERMPEIHTLLYMSKGAAQEVVYEALRRYLQQENHPALDPRVRCAIAIKALGLDPTSALECDKVLPDYQSAAASAAQVGVHEQPRPAPSAPEPAPVVDLSDAPAPAPVIASMPAPPPTVIAPTAKPIQPVSPPSPSPAIESSSGLRDRWLNGE